jgi:hypothetical protein
MKHTQGLSSKRKSALIEDTGALVAGAVKRALAAQAAQFHERLMSAQIKGDLVAPAVVVEDIAKCCQYESLPKDIAATAEEVSTRAQGDFRIAGFLFVLLVPAIVFRRVAA